MCNVPILGFLRQCEDFRATVPQWVFVVLCRQGASSLSHRYVSCTLARQCPCALLSLRSYGHWGSSVTSMSAFRADNALSINGGMHVGSFVSLRSLARLGSALSVFNSMYLWSSFSQYSCAHSRSAISELAFAHLGSSRAARMGARLGSNLSVIALFHIRSSWSLRSCGRQCSSLSLADLPYWLLAVTVSICTFRYRNVGWRIRAVWFWHVGVQL